MDKASAALELVTVRVTVWKAGLQRLDTAEELHSSLDQQLAAVQQQ